MLRKHFSILAVLILGSLPLWAQSPTAITHVRILTVTNGIIQDGSVVVDKGKIVAVGSDVRIPAGAQIIDGRGKILMPGIFDAGDQLGLVEIPFEHVTDDSTEYTDPVHPELQVLDALNTRSENIRIARPGGVTNAVVTPSGGNLIAGQSAVVQLDGDIVQQMVIKSPAALHINLGEPSKQTYGAKDRSPKTRMGSMALVRQAFLNAQSYKLKQSAASTAKGEPAARDLKLDALVSALNGEIPVVVRAARIGDIDAALRLADEFHLRLVLAEANSAWKLADKLAARKIPVILGNLLQAPLRIEAVDTRLDNAAILNKAGVEIAIQTASSNGVRDLWFAVGYAIANGLPADEALKAVTLNPARIFGVQDRLGSIEVGKDANLLLLDGEPFQTRSHVLKVLIGGRVVDLTNHQTELYEVYKKKYGIN